MSDDWGDWWGSNKAPWRVPMPGSEKIPASTDSSDYPFPTPQGHMRAVDEEARRMLNCLINLLVATVVHGGTLPQEEAVRLLKGDASESCAGCPATGHCRLEELRARVGGEAPR